MCVLFYSLRWTPCELRASMDSNWGESPPGILFPIQRFWVYNLHSDYTPSTTRLGISLRTCSESLHWFNLTFEILISVVAGEEAAECPEMDEYFKPFPWFPNESSTIQALPLNTPPTIYCNGDSIFIPGLKLRVFSFALEIFTRPKLSGRDHGPCILQRSFNAGSHARPTPVQGSPNIPWRRPGKSSFHVAAAESGHLPPGRGVRPWLETFHSGLWVRQWRSIHVIKNYQNCQHKVHKLLKVNL